MTLLRMLVARGLTSASFSLASSSSLESFPFFFFGIGFYLDFVFVFVKLTLTFALLLGGVFFLGSSDSFDDAWLAALYYLSLAFLSRLRRTRSDDADF